MKTYEVTISSEALVTVKVRAASASEANEKANERVAAILRRMSKNAGRYTVSFGDLTEYLPAEDDPTDDNPEKE